MRPDFRANQFWICCLPGNTRLEVKLGSSLRCVPDARRSIVAIGRRGSTVSHTFVLAMPLDPIVQSFALGVANRSGQGRKSQTPADVAAVIDPAATYGIQREDPDVGAWVDATGWPPREAACGTGECGGESPAPKASLATKPQRSLDSGIANAQF